MICLAFSFFDTLETDRWTDRDLSTEFTALCIALHNKNGLLQWQQWSYK